MFKALCGGANPDLMFPPSGVNITDEIRRTCHACTVRAECLNYALQHHIPHGVWGGMSTRERQQLTHSDRRRAPKPVQHGTPGGAGAHRRRGQRPCQRCVDAERVDHDNARRNPGIVGRTYLDHGQPVVVLTQWAGKGPKNVRIRRADGSECVRPFRGLRRTA
jgi:hypothetical protein